MILMSEYLLVAILHLGFLRMGINYSRHLGWNEPTRQVYINKLMNKAG